MPTTPSGVFIAPEIIISTSGYSLFNTFDTESFLIATTSGYFGGNPFLFESNTDVLLYKIPNLLRLVGDTFEKCGAGFSAICTTSEDVIIGAINNVLNKRVRIYTCSVNPPTDINWVSETTITGCLTYDALSNNTSFEDIPNLIGNNYKNTYPRMFRNTSEVSPIGVFSRSDTGLPSSVLLTDIESTEG